MNGKKKLFDMFFVESGIYNVRENEEIYMY